MQDLTTGSITRHLLKTMSFMLAMMVFQTLYVLVDLYWVGRLGTASVAAVGIAGNLMFVVLALTQMLGVGTTTVVAHAMGRRAPDDARVGFNQSLSLAALCGTLFLAVALALRTRYAASQGADPETVRQAGQYLLWFVPAMALQFPMVAMTSALRGVGNFKLGVAVGISTVAINMLLAPVLIFGWLGAPAMGVSGAAIASLVAIIIGTAWLARHFRGDTLLRFARAEWRPRPAVWKRMLAIGLPAGFDFAMMSVYLFVVYAVTRPFGAAAQAGFGIGMRVTQAGFMPVVALGLSVAPIAGQNFGARLAGRVRHTFRDGALLGAAMMLLFALVCNVAPAALIGVFTRDPAAVAVGVEYLRIISWSFVGSGIMFVTGSMFQAMGNTLPSVATSLVRIVVVAVPVLVLSRRPGFTLPTIWYLAVLSVWVQLGLALLLLRREYARRLTWTAGTAAGGATPAAAAVPAVLLLLLASPRGAGAQSPPAAPPSWAAAVDSMMRAEMARDRIPGAQIAIAQHGRLVYTKGYGVADAESGRPVTERTLFQVGSVTKAVTGALLAQLAAEGTVELQAPISRYVPEIAGRRVGTATVHQLLSMSSGWADVARPFGTTDEAALGRNLSAVGDTMILLEPGRIYSYSNAGYAMAGYVAERAAKAPFADLAERVVLRKLGMPRATFRPLVAMTHDFSLGHVAAPDRPPAVQRPMPVNAAEYPAGFLWASAAELVRLGGAMLGGGMLDGERVLAADAVRAMTTGYIRIPTGPRNWSGYGVHVDTVAGQRVWRKAGSVAGYYSELIVWPDLQLTVAVNVNRQADTPARADVRAAQLVTGLRLEAAPEAAERPATAEERRQVVGTYRAGTGTSTVEVAEVDGRLEWRGLRNTYPLRMVGANRLVAEPPGQAPRQVYVIRDAGGRVLYLFAINAAYVKQQPPPR